MQEFSDAAYTKYQDLVDEGYARADQALQSGKLQVPAGVPEKTVLGQFTDAFAQVGMKDWLADEGIDEGAGQLIQVNRYLYDPAGIGAYRIPDVSIPGASSISQISPLKPAGVFVYQIAPMRELGGLIQRLGGGVQYIVPNRTMWSDPVLIGRTRNKMAEASVNNELLKVKAIELTELLQKYAAVDPEAGAALRSLRFVLTKAIEGEISEPVEWRSIPGGHFFNEGSLRQYGDLENAFAEFRIEVTGGESHALKRFRHARSDNDD